MTAKSNWLIAKFKLKWNDRTYYLLISLVLFDCQLAKNNNRKILRTVYLSSFKLFKNNNYCKMKHTVTHIWPSISQTTWLNNTPIQQHFFKNWKSLSIITVNCKYFVKFSLKWSWQAFFVVFSCIFQIFRNIFSKIKNLSYMNFYRNFVTCSRWSMALIKGIRHFR